MRAMYLVTGGVGLAVMACALPLVWLARVALAQGATEGAAALCVAALMALACGGAGLVVGLHGEGRTR